MLGFSVPKLLLLFIILLIVWNLFKFFENKSKSKVCRDKKNQFDEEALTECNACGGFYDKSVKSNCPMCTKAFEK